jgi:hypothetical protein
MLSYTFSKGPCFISWPLRLMASYSTSLPSGRLVLPSCRFSWSVTGLGSLLLGLQTLEYRTSIWREETNPRRAWHCPLPRTGSAPSNLPYPGRRYLSSWDHLSLLLQFLAALLCPFVLLDAGIFGPRTKPGTTNGQLCSSPHHRASSQAGPGNCSQPHIGISGLRASRRCSCRSSRRGPGQLPWWEGRVGYLRPGAAPGHL